MQTTAEARNDRHMHATRRYGLMKTAVCGDPTQVTAEKQLMEFENC